MVLASAKTTAVPAHLVIHAQILFHRYSQTFHLALSSPLPFINQITNLLTTRHTHTRRFWHDLTVRPPKASGKSGAISTNVKRAICEECVSEPLRRRPSSQAWQNTASAADMLDC
ncbi:hypothetical protein J3458_003505 [Metarhizium acridum]|uniref:uncharacterized protein n=1 Tax=Metarhizium acridum TaxID=92637 RepID=UPI001C6B598D|nr:hypothetical protein J3458_003505 [Metarhizium acridum]